LVANALAIADVGHQRPASSPAQRLYLQSIRVLAT
jgi:hypothetical protein